MDGCRCIDPWLRWVDGYLDRHIDGCLERYIWMDEYVDMYMDG